MKTLEKFRTLHLDNFNANYHQVTNFNVLCDPNDDFLTPTTSATLQVACNQYHHSDTSQTLKAGTCLVRACMVSQKHTKPTSRQFTMMARIPLSGV
jgi:hypothetical protein